MGSFLFCFLKPLQLFISPSKEESLPHRGPLKTSLLPGSAAGKAAAFVGALDGEAEFILAPEAPRT